jgi:pimeloyl-ACP methyl ester carboxylesterase
MFGLLREFADALRPQDYRRRASLVLINGLAEQPESWFCNRRHWDRHFDLKIPEFLVYDGPVIHRRIEEGLPITVDFLMDQLELFLENFVQKPPYHLVGSSLGCQVAIEYAVRHPKHLGKIVLLCPSGVGGEEKLPVVEGVRHNDFAAIVASVFHNPKFVHPGIVRHYERQFANKSWRKGLLRTVRGTSNHCVRHKLPAVHRPTLVICGQQDRIVDPEQARSAVSALPNYEFVLIPSCGHAPQIERAGQVNRLVVDFLTRPELAPVQPEPIELLVPKPSYA